MASQVIGITAGTTRTQAGATVLNQTLNRVDTSTAPSSGTVLGDGVALPSVGSGAEYLIVINNTANPIQVYGNGSDTINGVAGATGVALPPKAIEFFVEAAPGSWQYDAGAGTSGQLLTVLAADAISAAGANQGAATALVADLNNVGTVGSGQGVALPAAAAGLDIVVINSGANPLTVYGNGSDTIDGVAGSTGVIMGCQSVVIFFATATGAWRSEGLATGYFGAYQTMSASAAVSAAGTTQATATPLTALVNNISTVASGTGVNLPSTTSMPAGMSLQICVMNNGANALLVYPAQGASDTINGQAAATGVALLPGSVAVFTSVAAGAWTVQPGSTKSESFGSATNTTSFTATAAQVTGGVASVDLALTGTLGSGQNITTPTATAIIAALHCPTVGTSYRLRICNQSGGAFSWTVVAGSGVTLTGTATIAQNTWREYAVTVTAIGTPAVTLQNLAVGTFS